MRGPQVYTLLHWRPSRHASIHKRTNAHRGHCHTARSNSSSTTKNLVRRYHLQLDQGHLICFVFLIFSGIFVGGIFRERDWEFLMDFPEELLGSSILRPISVVPLGDIKRVDKPIERSSSELASLKRPGPPLPKIENKVPDERERISPLLSGASRNPPSVRRDEHYSSHREVDHHYNRNVRPEYESRGPRGQNRKSHSRKRQFSPNIVDTRPSQSDVNNKREEHRYHEQPTSLSRSEYSSCSQSRNNSLSTPNISTISSVSSSKQPSTSQSDVNNKREEQRYHEQPSSLSRSEYSSFSQSRNNSLSTSGTSTPTPTHNSPTISTVSTVTSPKQLRTLQLELEKEKELYRMHSEAAVKSSEKICLLTQELSLLMDSSLSSFTASQEGLRSISTSANNNISLSSPLSSMPSSLGSYLSSSNGSNNTIDILNAVVTVKSKYFPRKPRCLIIPSSSPDTIITSSLDGSIQFSSLRKQCITKSIFIPSHLERPCMAERMLYLNRFEGFIVSSIDSSYNMQSEVDSAASVAASLYSTLIYIPLPQSNTTSTITTINFPSMKTLKAPESVSMDKGIGAMCSLRGDTSSFITAGNDKIVNLWELEADLTVRKVAEVHRSHTASIYDVTQSGGDDDILWSGGADTRLVGWSITSQRPVFNQRMSNRISHLLSNTIHPFSLMAVYTATESQIQIFDTRIPHQSPSHVFGHRENSPTSRYMRPAWSPCGNYVAFGTAVPENKSSGINLWDLRNLRERSPVKSYNFSATERRIINCEFNVTGNVLLATSTDCSMTFLDFNK